MPESVPICSHTFEFYQGTRGELEKLEKKFKKALSNHVKLFARTKDGSSFVVLTTSKHAVGVESRLNKVLDSELEISRRKSIGKALDAIEGFLYYSEDASQFLFESFKFKVYVTDNIKIDEFPDFILSLEETEEMAVDSNGNHCFLFDITHAKPYEAFMICKLSALLPLYTVYMKKNEHRIMPPFPSYYGLTDTQCNILSCLRECKDDPAAFAESFEDCTCTADGYLFNDDIARKLGINSKQPGKHLNPLENHNLIESKKIKAEGAVRAKKASTITNDGLFLLRYAKRDELNE